MNSLKRFELWVLAAVLLVGTVWVLTSRHPAEDEPASATSTASGTSAAPLVLHQCVLERDYGNARLHIELRIKNDEEEKLSCLPPKVRLLTTQGREVPSFFLAFNKPPEVPGKSAQDVELVYWLEAADLGGGLTLMVRDEKLPIKSEKPFDLKTVENTKKKTFKPGEW